MNIKILILAFALVFIIIATLSYRGDYGQAVDSRVFPKKDVYALFGALGQCDWEFVLANSTTEFRDEIIAGLIIQEQLIHNANLSKAVKKFVDVDYLEQEVEIELNQDESLKRIANAVSEKNQFFVAGLNSLNPSEIVSYSLQVPTKILEASFDCDSGSLGVYHQTQSENAVDFNGKLRFEKHNNKWKLAGLGVQDIPEKKRE